MICACVFYCLFVNLDLILFIILSIILFGTLAAIVFVIQPFSVTVILVTVAVIMTVALLGSSSGVLLTLAFELFDILAIIL